MQFSLGCILDDSTFIQLFEDSLSREEKGAHKICWDRQRRAALVGVHNTAEDLDHVEDGEFEDCLLALTRVVQWLIPTSSSCTARQPTIIHVSEGRWKRSWMLHLKAFVNPSDYAAAAEPWCLPGGVGTLEDLIEISSRDIRYHVKMAQYHSNTHVQLVTAEEQQKHFFPVMLEDGLGDVAPNKEIECGGMDPAVQWIGSKTAPLLFAMQSSGEGRLNSLSASEVKVQMLRIRGFLWKKGIRDFGFFIVPLFSSSERKETIQPATHHASGDPGHSVCAEPAEELHELAPPSVDQPSQSRSSTAEEVVDMVGGAKPHMEEVVSPVSCERLIRDQRSDPQIGSMGHENSVGNEQDQAHYNQMQATGGNEQDQAHHNQMQATGGNEDMPRRLFVRGFPIRSSIAEEVKEVHDIFKDVVTLTHVDVFDGRKYEGLAVITVPDMESMHKAQGMSGVGFPGGKGTQL
ncbi:hypothetical protein CEUSTIGMA_g7381.t1 [Chlamydomonas eustigma]|uniref:Uncharacterized protein n=1 Tax=Chlamydomonas eustigma TaxID=1157962 RepID=A0A250XA24_9CHLO|nr:hypothetical protein CEUSTIGMA_g7381.t1 [Chlamydomonas eustigma]|eukprot:GAX79941.1 hypothetical protein CEUSTIGMA_g7381.t1 [Chlamydomonas eustigma]